MESKIAPQIQAQFLAQIDRDMNAIRQKREAVINDLADSQRTGLHRDAVNEAKKRVDNNAAIGNRELKSFLPSKQDSGGPQPTPSTYRDTTVRLGIVGLAGGEPDLEIFAKILSGKAEVESAHTVKDLVNVVYENCEKFDKIVDQSNQQAQEFDAMLGELKDRKIAISEGRSISTESVVGKATKITENIYSGLGYSKTGN